MVTTKFPNQMKAWLLEDFNAPYVLREQPLPSIDNPNDVHIRVDACSYCHTDAVVAAGTVVRPSLPHVGCHEYAGTIVALPSGQAECHGFRVSDIVGVRGCGNHMCGQCRECKDPSPPLPYPPGLSVYCPHAGAGLGIDRSGKFREYAAVDGRQIAKLPEGLSAVDAAPLMCAGLTVYSALAKCSLKPGDRLGVMGCGGGLGHLALQFATKMGLKTTGIDVNPRALQLARELGTGATIIDASKEAAKETLPQQIGLDAVLILPETQQPFDYGMELVRDGGLVMLLSFPTEGFHVSAIDIVLRRVRLEGSLIGSNRAMNDRLDFCVRHGVRAKTTTYEFGQLNNLVDDFHKRTPGKLVLDMAKTD
ncbi:GroES-like protein [Lophiostoma macrostomum CBS 122681]|uniref:GroES-like protein n=1 Tax=Lophiostoma macrostomum CBS 122681 TaxID=1314788 RepID=A0A6A6SZY1_9PLEO|nr:GroES-like protein [Lophiostoma macrostomum CBS 122681]